MTGPREAIAICDAAVHYPVRRSFREFVSRLPRREVRAIDGVSLTVNEAEIVALVGESGSGKSTTGRVIMKLVPPSSGRVLFAGQDVTAVRNRDALAAFRRSVQMIFQNPYEVLNPRHTVGDFVMEPMIVNKIGRNRHDRYHRAEEALEAAGLSPGADFMARYPHQLSGGQRQRAAIASVLVMEPRVVVADEPVSMLDVSVQTQFIDLMLELREQRQIAYVFITHDLAVAWVVADRIAVMYLGRIVEIGPAEKIVAEPQHPYTQALISMSSSTARGHRRRLRIVGEVPNASAIPSGCRFHPRCPIAQDRCRTDDPALVETAPGSSVACWFPGPLSSEDYDQSESGDPQVEVTGSPL